jgi:hypothetical protein
MYVWRVMKRQWSELGPREKDNFVNLKYVTKNYFLNGSKATPTKYVEQSIERSKIGQTSTATNYWYSQQNEYNDISSYFGETEDLPDEVKDPKFFERQKQAICYLFKERLGGRRNRM